VARSGKQKHDNYCKSLVGGSQRKKPHGRPTPRKEDNIKKNLKELERKKSFSGFKRLPL
jgi:hypothetical protein